jgi:mannose-6-phosphate isomerase
MIIEQRPWGKFEILLDAENTKVKRITVKPKGILSYQYHHKRSEHWIVIEGTATVIINGLRKTIEAGDSIYLPVGVKHRVSNEKVFEDLVFIEVQTGTYFGEDDIVRIEDAYNRVIGERE